MKKIVFIIAVLVTSTSAIGYNLLASHTHDPAMAGYDIRNDHSGGTDASGCHTETATGVYHCH
jgi:hypothetical protein